MNSISTMKYNVKITLVLVFDSSIIKPLNFVPKILFDFFRRWQNVYVLIISIALTIIRVVHPYIKFYEP